MTQMMRKKITTTLAVAALSALAMTASAGEYYVSASAPISYKMSNPNMMPGFAAPIQGIARTTGPAASFDASRVDPALYAHQMVGNPYTVAGQTYVPAHNPAYDMVGSASSYGSEYHGKLTASGEIFDKNAMTAAHKTLPMGSLVIVTNISTGQSLTVRINDRGPFVGNRMIDLSEAAANALGHNTSGLGDIRVQYAGPAASISTPAPQQFAQIAPTAPQSQPQYNVPNITAPMMPQTSLPQSRIAIPQAHAENNTGDNTLTTLTIKGPVHMANHNSANGQARLIKAVYRTTK